MHRSTIDPELRRLEAIGELHALLREQVALRNDEQRRRQSSEVAAQRTHVRVVGVALVAQVIAPETFHLLGGHHVSRAAESLARPFRSVALEEAVVPNHRTEESRLSHARSNRK